MSASPVSVPTAPRPDRRPPVARGRLPVIGHLARLVRDPLSFMQEIRHEGDIVRVYLGTLPMYVVNSPELIQDFMVVKVDSFEKGRMFEKARHFMGDGITTTSGPRHQRQRRIMQPAFNHVSVRVYADEMSRLAGDMAESWQPQQSIRLDEELHQLTLAIATRTLVSGELEARTGAVVREAMPVIAKQLPVRTIFPDGMEKIPLPANRRFSRLVSELWQAIDETIALYRKGGIDTQDLLSQLIAARDPHTDEAMTDQEIRDEVVAVLLGGYGAVKSILTWLFIELDKHPDVERRLHDEIDRVIRTGPVAYERLPQLEYTRQVINETLRLHHVALMLTRRALEPVTLGSTTFPAGSNLMFSQAALHRDPKLYPEPLRFDPDRWAPGWKDRLPQGAFIPFSIGPHQCIGTAFAMSEMTTIVAAIARRWKLRLQPGTTVRPVMAAIITPDQAPMTVIPR